MCLNDVLPAFLDSKAEEVDAISEKLRIILKVGSLSAGFSRLASLAPLHRPNFVSPMSYGLRRGEPDANGRFQPIRPPAGEVVKVGFGSI